MLQEIKHKVDKIVNEKLQLLQGDIIGTATLPDLGADNIDLVIMALQFERKFKIEISEKELAATSKNTMNDLYKLIHEKILANTQPPTNEGI